MDYSTTQRSALDTDAVRAAYRRWAGVYDLVFGGVSAIARRRTVRAVNALPGGEVLEVGVGTGLALPLYAPGKRVTGIDLSADMLEHARQRVRRKNLSGVAGLHVMDAEAMGFPDAHFDIAVAMFVASVVPRPLALLDEMCRVVRPGGHLLFVNHFSAEAGPRLWIERAMAPASRALGWHPDFARSALMGDAVIGEGGWVKMPPGGLFTLLHLPRDQAASLRPVGEPADRAVAG